MIPRSLHNVALTGFPSACAEDLKSVQNISEAEANVSNTFAEQSSEFQHLFLVFII